MKISSIFGMLLLFGLIAVVASPASAQQSESTSVLRADDSQRINRYLAVLSSAGITLDPSMPRQTRSEFAAAIQRWLKQHRQGEQGFDTETTRQLQQHREAADAFRRLVSEFTSELMALAVDTFDVKISFIRFVRDVSHDEFSLPSPIAPQSDPTNFLPESDWLHQAIENEEQAGIILNPPDFPGTYSGPPPSLFTTRHELAEALTTYLYLFDPVGAPLMTKQQTDEMMKKTSLPQDLADDFRAQFQAHVEQNPEQIQGLLCLVTKLGPELEAIGQNESKTEWRLSALEQRADLLPSNHPFPAGNSAYAAIQTLVATGLIRQSQQREPLHMTRHQWALALTSVLTALPKTAVEIARDETQEENGDTDYEAAERHQLVLKLARNPAALAALLLITKSLRPEIRQIGRLSEARLSLLTEDVKLQSQAAPEPFKNVPLNHWANESVEALRKAGILIGYPNGSFWLKGPG